MRIAVIGAGGVGAYFGGRLAVSGNDVTLIARGRHLDAIREQCLRVRSVHGDFTVAVPATDDPAQVGPCDAVLFCVKSYDTEAAAALLHPLLDEETAVISLQNGIDNEEKIAALIGANHVVGGAAFIFSAIAEPGVVVHTGGPAKIVFGELDGVRSQRVERLLMACREAGIDADIPADIRVVLWTKFAFICATAGLTSAVRLPLGDIRTCPESRQLFRRILVEVVALARAEGVLLSDGVIDQQLGFAERLEPGSYSSLHHDLVNRRRMELEALQGTVVRRAAEHGVLAPVSEVIYGVLRPWALQNEADARHQGTFRA
jgi:2-dehydropantoate 2-reductase